jgi:hypothetical protein
MARIDDLPADQQAVLRLLLTQERSYEEIARSLRMAPAAVRDRAHEALTTLGPAGGQVAPARRAQITDYLLGQQSDSDALGTYEALERSPSERGWARVVSGELSTLASRDLPEVPGASANGVAAILEDDDAPTEESGAAVRAKARADGVPRSSRRGGAILLGVLGVLATLAIGFFIGRATKDSSGNSGSSKQPAASTSGIFGQANLKPPAGSSSGALAVAYFLRSNGANGVGVTAQKLPALPKKSGYPIWLTGKNAKPLLLGYIQSVDANGSASGVTKLKQNPRDYNTVVLGEATKATPSGPVPLLSGAVTFGASSAG